MNTPHYHVFRSESRMPALSVPKITATLFLVATMTAVGQAQTTSATNVDAATLAKYDSNSNGRLDPGELATLQADQAKAANTPVSSTATATGEKDVVELSPFEVTEHNHGYYAANTMSGTRLNAKIEDLASSISVVTKEQMKDFAMLDINDIFNYEASTEGTGNYTDFSVDRNGMVTDNIQNNPQGANRIRGVGAANIALNNFATSGRVPIDPISVDSVEISRGPNSSIFGLGTGSGTVNLNASTANLSRETTTVEARLDSIGGYRTSLDLNRPIMKGKLALRGSFVFQHDAYNEKPSGGTTRRYNFMLRAQPFKNTTVRASFQAYDFYGTRASTITPRDAVSYWKGLGSPTWDPITSTVTTGGVSTVMGTTNPTGLGGQNFGDPILFVDGGIQLWMISRLPAATATNGPNNQGGTLRLLETQADPVRTGHPLYSTVRGISSKALFDWSSINLAGINSIKDHNETTTVELEQYILNTETQKLAAQVGWNREDAERINKNLVGQSSATGNSGYLYVDVNSKLLDGRVNPFFGKPYLGAGEPVHESQPYQRDSFRGQLAYLLDFTNSPKWTKWLGRHQVVGYAEERITKTYRYRFREANLTDNAVYAPAGQPKGNQSSTNGFVVAPLATRGYYHFYVGDNVGQNIDYAPTAIAYGNYNFNWFNPLANSGAGAWVADSATLGEAGITEGTAGNFGLQNLIKTRGVVIQSTLLEDRLVLTGGKRHDDNYNKFQRPPVLKANGYDFDYAAMDGWVRDWAYRQGDTKTWGMVGKPFRGFKAVESMASKGGAPGFFGSLLSGFSMHYNKSDSFTPENPAVAVTLEQLGNPTSNGNDYGFSLNLLDGRLVIRANRYTTNQILSRNGQFGTFGQRVLRLDIQQFAGNNDNFALQKVARIWTQAANPTFTTAQVDAAVYTLMGLTAEQVATYNTSTIGETQDVTAKGDELEINFNPDPYITLRANITKTQSIDANVAPHIPAWVALRTPKWTSIIDPRNGASWFDQAYDAAGLPLATGGTAHTFLTGNVVSPINLAQATQGKARPQIREWHYNASASLRLAKYTEHKILKNVNVGGSLRWESKGAIGYYGIPIAGDYSVATAFDPDRPIYSKANTYIDAFVTYNTRLFHDKVRARFQFNARNIQEWKAHLETVGAYPDGSGHTFRVIEPVSFIFSSTFDL